MSFLVAKLSIKRYWLPSAVVGALTARKAPITTPEERRIACGSTLPVYGQAMRHLAFDKMT